MDQATIDSLRRRLDQERIDLVAQLTDMGMDPETGGANNVEFDHGFADSGQATAEKARVLSIAEGLVETLHEVDAAIERMKKGTYGKCDNCGNDIPLDRMEARPYARQCLSCKQRLG